MLHLVGNPSNDLPALAVYVVVSMCMVVEVGTSHSVCTAGSLVHGRAAPGRYLISQHPEAEAKIVEELDAAGLLVTAERPHPRTLAVEDLSSLEYLSACIKARAQSVCSRPCTLKSMASSTCPWPLNSAMLPNDDGRRRPCQSS